MFQASPYSRLYCFSLGKFCLTCFNFSTGGCRESKPFNIYLWDWLLCSAKWPRVPKRVLPPNLPKSTSEPPPAGLPKALSSSCQRQGGECQAGGGPAVTASVLQKRCPSLDLSLQLLARSHAKASITLERAQTLESTVVVVVV